MPLVKKVVVRKERNKTAKDHARAQWSTQQKYKAVATFLICGNLTVTAAETKIPLDTLFRWKASPWWKETEQEIRNSYLIKEKVGIQKLADKVMTKLEDRIDNGDYFYNPKTGKLERIPVKARDLTILAKTAWDRDLVLEKLRGDAPTPHTAQDINAKLASLAESFKALAKRQKPQTGGEVIDVTEISREPQGETQQLEQQALGEGNGPLGQDQEVNQ